MNNASEDTNKRNVIKDDPKQLVEYLLALSKHDKAIDIASNIDSGKAYDDNKDNGKYNKMCTVEKCANKYNCVNKKNVNLLSYSNKNINNNNEEYKSNLKLRRNKSSITKNTKDDYISVNQNYDKRFLNQNNILNNTFKKSLYSKCNSQENQHCGSSNQKSDILTTKPLNIDNDTIDWSYNSTFNLQPYKRSDAYKSLYAAANSSMGKGKHSTNCEAEKKCLDLKNELKYKLPCLNLNTNSLINRHYNVDKSNKVEYSTRKITPIPTASMHTEYSCISNSGLRGNKIINSEKLQGGDYKKTDDIEDIKDIENNDEPEIIDMIRQCILDIASDRVHTNIGDKRDNPFMRILAKKLSNRLREQRVMIREEERELAREEYLDYIEEKLLHINNTVKNVPSDIAKSIINDHSETNENTSRQNSSDLETIGNDNIKKDNNNISKAKRFIKSKVHVNEINNEYIELKGRNGNFKELVNNDTNNIDCVGNKCVYNKQIREVRKKRLNIKVDRHLNMGRPKITVDEDINYLIIKNINQSDLKTETLVEKRSKKNPKKCKFTIRTTKKSKDKDIRIKRLNKIKKDLGDPQYLTRNLIMLRKQPKSFIPLMDTIDLTVEDSKLKYTCANLVDIYFKHRNTRKLPLQTKVTRKWMTNLGKATLLSMQASSEHFEANYEDLVKLGAGGFGTVYKAVRTIDQLPVAIKQISRSNIHDWEKDSNGSKVPREIAILRKTYQIEGVIHMLDYFEMPDCFVIVMERPVKVCDMFDYINIKGTICEEQAMLLFHQTLKAVVDIYDLGIVHRDIKDENILVNIEKQSIKLIDFGSAAYTINAPFEDFDVGTKVYCPPEWQLLKPYDGISSTVWTLGILLYNMVTGNIPFENDKEIMKGNIKFIKGEISDDLRHLIRNMLKINPSERLTFEMIFDHPWMNKINEIEYEPSDISSEWESVIIQDSSDGENE